MEMKNAFTLLVADSNPYVRSFLQRELAGEGYQVRVAGTSKEIFNCFRSGCPPDLLVMDLDMPVKIGLEVLRRLYNLVPRIPVVVYTHHMEYDHHADAQGVDIFIEKNGNPIPLKNAIADVLHSHHTHCIE
ncbi:MAG: response regulator [Desulfobacterales bacterium]|nr:response regulator [Desulfobacterales bacterium]